MKEILIGGVRVTVTGDDLVEPGAPVILAVQVHGRTRSRQDCIKFAKYLQAVPNLVCATWDLPNHGDRLIDEKANASWNEGNTLHLVEMQSIIDQGSAEAVTILRNLPYHFPEFNIVHKVVIGVSLGGYITWKVASEHSELLAAAVPIISSPNLPQVMLQRYAQIEEKHPELTIQQRQTALPIELMAYLQEGVEKNQQLKRKALPMLAICGGSDPLVPPKFTVEWGEDAAPCQRVEIIPNVEHEVPREMIDLTAEYLTSLVSKT